MKQILIILCVLLILLLGCSETIVEKNITVEVIKECPVSPDCICNFPEIPDCNCGPQKVIEKEVIPSSCTLCTNRLSTCQTQSQYYSDQLADCLINNETRSIENITAQLNICIDDLEEVNKTLKDMKDLLD